MPLSNHRVCRFLSQWYEHSSFLDYFISGLRFVLGTIFVLGLYVAISYPLGFGMSKLVVPSHIPLHITNTTSITSGVFIWTHQVSLFVAGRITYLEYFQEYRNVECMWIIQLLLFLFSLPIAIAMYMDFYGRFLVVHSVLNAIFFLVFLGEKVFKPCFEEAIGIWKKTDTYEKI